MTTAIKFQLLRKLWKNEYVQTAVVIGLIVLVVFGFWYGSQLALNTQYPVLAVVSGSMCVPYDGACQGWFSLTHPFERTLHVGDLIVVQGVSPENLNANYPDSDVIVFHKPGDPEELIVHRIVATEERNGVLYFFTKGDGNGVNKWPDTPTRSEYDPWNNNQGVPQDLVVGKVIMRIPYLGHVVLFMRNSFGLVLVVALVVLLVVVEFVVPILRGKKAPAPVAEQPKQAPQ